MKPFFSVFYHNFLSLLLGPGGPPRIQRWQGVRIDDDWSRGKRCVHYGRCNNGRRRRGVHSGLVTILHKPCESSALGLFPLSRPEEPHHSSQGGDGRDAAPKRGENQAAMADRFVARDLDGASERTRPTDAVSLCGAMHATPLARARGSRGSARFRAAARR